MDWRPIPRSANQQQVRFGAFYPPFSLENGAHGWESPFTYSYSAINTWLGEEVRPLGAEWSLRRRLASTRNTQEVRVFASGFYGNDPAATLLFWRGWSLHDRQTRLNDTAADSADADLRRGRRRRRHDTADGSAVHGNRSPPRLLRRRRVALRAPRARATRALRQSRRSVELRRRAVGLAHVVRPPGSADNVARGARAHGAVDAGRDVLARRHARRPVARSRRGRNSSRTSSKRST